jgi:hypothetical protein
MPWWAVAAIQNIYFLLFLFLFNPTACFFWNCDLFQCWAFQQLYQNKLGELCLEKNRLEMPVARSGISDWKIKQNKTKQKNEGMLTRLWADGRSGRKVCYSRYAPRADVNRTTLRYPSGPSALSPVNGFSFISFIIIFSRPQTGPIVAHSCRHHIQRSINASTLFRFLDVPEQGAAGAAGAGNEPGHDEDGRLLRDVIRSPRGSPGRSQEAPGKTADTLINFFSSNWPKKFK